MIFSTLGLVNVAAGITLFIYAWFGVGTASLIAGVVTIVTGTLMVTAAQHKHERYLLFAMICLVSSPMSSSRRSEAFQ